MRVVLHLDPDSIEITEKDAGGPFPWLIGVPTLQLGVRAGHLQGLFNTEAPHGDLTFDNSGGQFAEFCDFPLRVYVEVFDDADELYFEGLVQFVKFGPHIVYTVEA
jgi:hypothetical protein